MHSGRQTRKVSKNGSQGFLEVRCAICASVCSKPSIPPQTGARQLELKGNLRAGLPNPEPKTKKPSDLPGERNKLNIVKTTAYLAGRPGGEARLSACSAETVSPAPSS